MLMLSFKRKWITDGTYGVHYLRQDPYPRVPATFQRDLARTRAFGVVSPSLMPLFVGAYLPCMFGYYVVDKYSYAQKAENAAHWGGRGGSERCQQSDCGV